MIRPVSGAVSGLWADDPRWLLDALDERRTREQERWEPPRRYFRGSEAGETCIRCLCLSAMGWRRPVDARTGRIFAAGRAIEAANVAIARELGLVVGEQMPVTVGGYSGGIGQFIRDPDSPSPPILGHADMVVECPADGRRFVVEWKTINSNGWRKLPPEHGPMDDSPLISVQYRAACQVNLYAWGLGIEDALLVFENKDTSAQRAYWLRWHSRLLDETLTRYTEAAPYILSNPQRIPPRLGRSTCRNYLCRRLSARGATYEEAREMDARLRGGHYGNN